MKKILLSFLFTAGAFAAARAQNTFTTEKASNNDSSVTTGVSTGEVKVYNRIRAINGNVKVKWNITSYSNGAGTVLPSGYVVLANGWAFGGLCDNFECRNSVNALAGATYVTNDYPSTIVSNALNDFHAVFDADNAAANTFAYVRVNAVDNSNANSSRTITLLAFKSPTGVTSVNRYDDNIVVYPNPATSAVNVIFDKSSKIRTIAVYNLIGQATDMYRVSGNSANLQLSDAPAGVYFLRMLDERGNIVATRRFNRQ
jgi:hypothetical protein